jgi:hypothetical protein
MLMIVVINGNSGDGGIRRIKATGEIALKKTRAARVYREEGRLRSSDRWIPSKFPERTTTVRSVEVVREIIHRSFGDRDFNMQSSLDNENPDFAICEIPTESEPSDQHVI